MSEKLPRPNGYINQPEQDTSEFYLNEINKYLIQNGFIPNFDTVEEFRVSTGTTKLNVKSKLRNAYNYFIKGKTNRGQPPSEFTYGRAKPQIQIKPQIEIKPQQERSRDLVDTLQTENLNTSEVTYENTEKEINLNTENEIFNTPKMNEEFQATGDVLQDFTKRKEAAKPSIPTWKSEKWVNRQQPHFKDLFKITKDGFNVSHNSKYMSEDYFNQIMKPNKKYEGWTFNNTKDIDGDNIPDAVIADDKNRLRYFNGYSITDASPESLADYRHKYMIDPANKGNYDNEAFQAYYRKLFPQEVTKPKSYNDVIKTFATDLYKRTKEYAKKLGDKQLMRYLVNTNFKGRIESILNRFSVLPFALVEKGYNENEFKKAIFAIHQKGVSNPDYSLLVRLYQDRKEVIKSVFNTKQAKDLLTAVTTGVANAFDQIASSNAQNFIRTLIHDPNDFTLGEIVYNETMKLAKQGLNTI